MAVLQAPGGELYYEIDGDGVPVVRDADTLYSHAGDLWLLLDHLGIEQAVLVGMSMGGRGRGDARCSRAGARPRAPRCPARRRAVGRGVQARPAGDPRAASGRRSRPREGGLVRPRLFRPCGDPDVARRLAEMLDEYSGVNWTSPDPHSPHPDSIELLGTISAPTTVVVAELDVPCFRDMSGVLAERIPGARKVAVPGVGHMVNMEAPEAVNALLREAVSKAGHSPTDRADCDKHRPRGPGG